MKRVLLIIVGVIVSAALVFGLIKFTKHKIEVFKGKTYSLDISKFKGKIINSNDAYVSGSIIYISMDEALKSGENAILCYSKRGIKIISPNTLAPLICSYSSIGTENDSPLRFIKSAVTISTEKIIVRETPTIFNYIFSAVLFLALLALIIVAVLSTFIILFDL